MEGGAAARGRRRRECAGGEIDQGEEASGRGKLFFSDGGSLGIGWVQQRRLLLSFLF
jgi:hypothetical protein